MKNFYTLDEYFNLYKDQLTKPFEDKLGRAIISRLLVSIYKILPENIKDSVGNCWYDLSFTDTKYKYAMEVKQRQFSSDSFPTHLINSEKFRSAVNALENKQFDYGYVATIWKDGVIWINDILDEDRQVGYHYQNITTQVSSLTDGQKVKKQCIEYEPKDIYYVVMQYFHDTNTELDGHWIPLIRREPIDINKLEEFWNNRQNERSLGKLI